MTRHQKLKHPRRQRHKISAGLSEARRRVAQGLGDGQQALESEELSKYPHITGIAPQTVKLIERFKDLNPGDTVTDSEMTALIGRNTRDHGVGGGAGNLDSATRYVERHHGRIVRRIKGAGIVKCLNASEVVNVVERRREHIGRTSRRAGRELSHVDTAKLEPAEKTKALVLRAQIGMLSSFASANTQKRLADNTDLEKWQAQQRKMLASM